MIVDKITCPNDVDGRKIDMPQHTVIKVQFLGVVYLKGRERANEDGASKRRMAVRMLLCMMGQEARGESSSVGETKNAVEGALLFDRLRKKVIGFHDRLFIVVDCPWPPVEAEVWPFVETANAGSWWRVDFALNVME